MGVYPWYTIWYHLLASGEYKIFEWMVQVPVVLQKEKLATFKQLGGYLSTWMSQLFCVMFTTHSGLKF